MNRYHHNAIPLVVPAVCIALVPWVTGLGSEPIRIGILGCDTSHATAFAKIINNPSAEGPLADVQVVAAFPGGSPDLPSSWDRVAEYTAELRQMGILIVDSIDALIHQVDAVLLESVDGRPHLAQARPVLISGKPIFIDKPVAGTLEEAVEIFDLAEEHKTPCFSSSALRFSKAIYNARQNPDIGDILGCAAYSPCPLEPHHPDLFWYGVHGVETLYTIMGPGCEKVMRVQTDGTEHVVGVWNDGRIGSFRGMRSGTHGYGALVYGTKSITHIDKFDGYDPLVIEIARFFKTGHPPVSSAETLEIFAFMTASDESKRQAGIPVSVPSVLAKARAKIDAQRAAHRQEQ